MILLIGVTGFLGPVVLEKLLEKKHSVKCLVRPDSSRIKLEEVANRKGRELSFSTGTLQSEDSIFNSIKDVNAVIYLVDLKNTYLVKNFLQTARRTSLKRVVFISSTTVLLPMKNKVKESKINSENLIKKSNLDYTILRPTMIYGSEDDENFSKMIRFIKMRGFFITFGSGENLIQPIHIEDVADAAVNVLENSKTYKKTYEICGKEPLKYNQMLKIVRNKMKKQFIIIKLPISLSKFLVSIYSKISKNSALTPDQIERMRINKSYSYKQAEVDFNFSPISFENSIKKLIKKIEYTSEEWS